MFLSDHNNTKPGHIVIIGNGISGITCAREVRKISDQPITVISSESTYFFSRTALMYVFMGHMKFEHLQPYENSFWEKNRISLVKAHVQKIDFISTKIHLDNEPTISYDKLVIATGSVPNMLNCPGQHLEGVMGMYGKQDLENLEKYSQGCKHAVIAGGGLIGIELAEMLHSRNIPVSFLVREAGFWRSVLPPEESDMINRHIKEHLIDLRLSTTIKEIVPGTGGKVKAVVTNNGETIECQVVGITAGVSPNVNFLGGSVIKLGKGIIVNRYLETSIDNVYAIGDCAEQEQAIGLRKPVEAVWYTGRIMGETLAKTLCGQRTAYEPGHWFNSAKFFDIEYQTYGWVSPNPGAFEEQFYWEHPGGKKAIRISWHKESQEFLGINCLGIRMRHEFFNSALTNKLPVDVVVKNLKKANFDPEMYHTYEKEISMAFKKTNQPHFQQ